MVLSCGNQSSHSTFQTKHKTPRNKVQNCNTVHSYTRVVACCIAIVLLRAPVVPLTLAFRFAASAATLARAFAPPSPPISFALALIDAPPLFRPFDTFVKLEPAERAAPFPRRLAWTFAMTFDRDMRGFLPRLPFSSIVSCGSGSNG
jgi:hypothetical protein